MILKASTLLRGVLIAIGVIMLVVAISQQQRQKLPATEGSVALTDVANEDSKPQQPKKPVLPKKKVIDTTEDTETEIPVKKPGGLKKFPVSITKASIPVVVTSAPEKNTPPQPAKNKPAPDDGEEDDDDTSAVPEIDVPDAADVSEQQAQAEELTEMEAFISDTEANAANEATEVLPEPEESTTEDENNMDDSLDDDDDDDDDDDGEPAENRPVKMIPFPKREKRVYRGETGAEYVGYNTFACWGKKERQNYQATQLLRRQSCVCNPKNSAKPACNPKEFKLEYTPDVEKRKPWNVVLISVDTMRRDVLSFYFGRDPRKTTRFLNKKFLEAIKFETHFGNAPWTLPSHSAMLTGLYPEQVGSLDSDHWIKVPKLPHYLGDQYVKYGVVQNLNLTPDGPISEEDMKGAMNKTFVAAPYQFGWSAGWDSYTLRATPARYCRNFIESDKKGKPYFLFCHTNVMHDYDGDYYASARELDNQLERVMSAIDFESTIVIFTADHGEGLEPARGRVGHGKRLHNDLTHLASAIWLPMELKKQYNVTGITSVMAPTSNVDIVPTILKLIGDDQALSSFSGEFMLRPSLSRSLYAVNRNALMLGRDNYRTSKARFGADGGFTLSDEIELRTSLSYPMKYIMYRADNMTAEQVYNIYNDYAESNELQALDNRAVTRSMTKKGSLEFAVLSRRSWSKAVSFDVFRELRNTILPPKIGVSLDATMNGYRLQPSKFGATVASVLEDAKTAWVVFVMDTVRLPQGWLRDFQDGVASGEQIFGGVGVSKGQLVGHWNDNSGHHYRLESAHSVECENIQLGWFAVSTELADKCKFALVESTDRYFVKTTESTDACKMTVRNAFSIIESP